MHQQRDARHQETRLVLRNEGPALARDVEAELEEGPRIPSVIGLEALPVNLHPGQAIPFLVPLAMGDAAMFRVTVRWTDGAGGREERYTLSTL